MVAASSLSPHPPVAGRIPVLPRDGVRPRPHLLQRLDAGERAKLTLLSAPAGFGKTTLLRDWFAQQARDVVWIDLSPADDDPVRFWMDVITAMQRTAGGFDGDIIALLSGQSPSSERLAAVLVERMSALPAATILVFDNFQVIETPSIHSALAALVEHRPPNVQVVIASRTDPDVPLSRLRSQGQLVEVRGDDLQLTPQESRQFLNGVMRLGLSDRDADLLHARTEGWPAGLRLAATALGGSGNGVCAVEAFGGNHPYVLDYVADEVLHDLPQEVYSFLVRTSIAQSICAGLCEAITGRPRGQLMLRRLRRMNLFLIPLDQHARWYRYHPCFAQALARRLEDEGADQIKELHQRAMRWYTQRGLLREAVHHALTAGDFSSAANAIERQVHELIWERGEITPLLAWLDALPPDVVRARPGLCLAHAWALALTGQLGAIEEHLTVAERSSDSSDGVAVVAALGPQVIDDRVGSGLVQLRVPELAAQLDESTLAEIAAVRAIAAGSQIDTARLVSWSTEAVLHAPENQFLRSVLALSRGRALDFAQDIRGAFVAYAEARDLSAGIANMHIQAVATSRLAELWAVQGELHQAAETHRSVLRMADQESNGRSAVGAMAHVGLGGLLHEWNDLRAAADRFGEGMKQAAVWGHLETLKGAYFGLARVRFAEGAGDEALLLLSEAEAIARHSNAPRSITWIQAMQARMSLAQGNTAAAVRWSETYPLQPDREPLHLFTGEYTTLARLRTAQGEYDESLALLGGLLHTATADHRLGLMIEILVLQALTLQARGSLRSALLPLRKALALATPAGYIRTFLDEGMALVGLLARASSHSEMSAHLTVLLAAGSGIIAGSARSSSLPWVALTPREREVLRHVAAGESNGEIARQLVLTLATVKRHVSNIFDKLGATSRTQAVARAREWGLLE
jgi:LuxR family maltose regulon positive regulatory protein